MTGVARPSEPEPLDGPKETAGRGSCLCEAVRFEITGPMRPVIYCHCRMCRRWSGHLVAATACRLEQLRLLSADTLSWYQSSPKARRGFCQVCGSSLFWQPTGGDYVAIMAGALDTPTKLTSSEHIFVADGGDYYQILDALPRRPGSRNLSHHR